MVGHASPAEAPCCGDSCSRRAAARTMQACRAAGFSLYSLGGVALGHAQLATAHDGCPLPPCMRYTLLRRTVHAPHRRRLLRRVSYLGCSVHVFDLSSAARFAPEAASRGRARIRRARV